MKVCKLSDYKRGWIVGQFSPSLFSKNYEIGFKYYRCGDCEASHRHDLSSEITVILYGEVKINNNSYYEGDIIIQEKGDYADFECLSDRAITAVYRPDGSFPDDKYFK